MTSDIQTQIAQLQEQIQTLQQQVQQLEARANAPQILHTQERFDISLQHPDTLDSPVVWTRRRETSEPIGTHQILSLIMEEAGKKSWPWPLYIHLTTSHDEGDAVGAYVRLHHRGNNWATSFHTDVDHDCAG